MNVLAAYNLHRLLRFDVWSVLVWTNGLIVIGLITTLVISLRRDKVERTPANLMPFLDDEKLEGPHLERVLGWALFFFAVFAITMPLYWLREAAREKGSDTYFNENAVKRGEELFSNDTMPNFNAALSLQCANCHGVTAGGGAAPYTYTDQNTGIAHSISWKAPPLNTVLYRFSPSEVNDIITRGRPGSPMQGWGVDRNGGGPKNAQSINDLVAYLTSIQLPPGTPAQAAKDLAGCQADTPKDATTALGQAACAQAAWKAEPAQQLTAAQSAYDTAVAARSADTKKFDTLGCRDSFEADDAAAKAEQDPAKQSAALANRDTCQTLRLAVKRTPDPSTPLDPIAKDAAIAHLAALQKTAATTPDELKAAKTEVATTTKQLTNDTADFAAKQCHEDGTGPASAPQNSAACLRLARGLYAQRFVAQDDSAVDAAKTALDWAKEWSARRANVGDGQILFETNCARCHTKNWSIFDPTNSDLKPEDLLGDPGGGGSIGFNLRAGEMQRRFPDIRGTNGDLTPDSGKLSHDKFILEGSIDGKLYGVGGRGSGMMPGQCNQAVLADTTVKLKYYGCMLSQASTPLLAPTKFSANDPFGGVDNAMLEQILLYERCGLDKSSNLLNAATNYESNCK